MKKLLCFLLLATTFSFPETFAQKLRDSNLDATVLRYAKSSFDELYELLSLPNDAQYIDAIEKNIRWCETAFVKRGFTTARLDTERVPLLLASRNSPRAKKTVLVYLQLDGQPVAPEKWLQESPWKPVLKVKEGSRWKEIPWAALQKETDPEWRIFARSASDAKGPVMMFLKAMDIINDHGVKPNFNIKVIMDFEEEMGSPRLPKAVLDYKDELKSEMLVIFDGPMHITNRPTLLFGARGIVRVTLETFGPRVPVHSGHYGNYAPNPALRLSQLLGAMKDSNGKVLLPGWYDGISLSDEIMATLKQVPDDEKMIREKIGIATTDHVAGTYQESIQYPSLNILGIQSGWVGNATRTIIPSTAVAELDIRLVKESDPEKLLASLKAFIQQQGFHIIESDPTEEARKKFPKLIKMTSKISYGAFRTEFDTEAGKWLRKAMRNAFKKDPIQIRTVGGSVPIAPFVNTLNIPAVIVPTVNTDNNQHSPNENIRLGNYIDGIKTITAILREKLR
ncbi:MAG: M20/M25/M40 family metallo-hydrolase [Bacteroidota bacterium]